jgi:hypothetical protein
MTSLTSISALLLLAITGVALADLPKKAPISRYSGLWMNSPFTSKPPPPDSPDAPNPLDDYALIGVSPIGVDSFRVSLINKKKPEERIFVDSDKASKDGFKIIEVIRKAGDPLGTKVSMLSGTTKGTVEFDQKLLTLVPPPKAAPPVPGQPQIPGQPPQVDANGNPLRMPRPRVVPPPAPATGVPGQQIPQNLPQPVPQPNVQPAQQLQQNNHSQQNERPSRRGN